MLASFARPSKGRTLTPSGGKTQWQVNAAIAILEASPGIHILLTDVDMPGSMDGLKLSAAVRHRWPPVRIVVTSGHRMVAATDLPEGSLFFSKPYAPNTLAGSLRDLVVSPDG